tara:strand:- start:1930 stop:2238 length:309 start_codon:yes stop_codon:yes gene_type:complete
MKRVKYNSGGELQQFLNINELNNARKNITAKVPVTKNLTVSRNIQKGKPGYLPVGEFYNKNTTKTDIIKLEKNLNKGRSLTLQTEKVKGQPRYFSMKFKKEF